MAKNDPGSNYTMAEGLSASSRTAGTEQTVVVDHALAPSCSFAVTAGAVETSLTATLQYSDSAVGGFVAEPDTTAGNEISGALTGAGSFVIDCPNPRARYSHLSVVTEGVCVYGVINVSGPNRSVSP